MQSIFGALLAAGYAAAANATIQASGMSQDVSNSIQTQLVRSFGGAEAIAAQYPQYATGITAAAKASFLAGDQWAYLAGIAAVLLGAVLVFFFFPKQAEEEAMLARFQAEDAMSSELPLASPQTAVSGFAPSSPGRPSPP